MVILFVRGAFVPSPIMDVHNYLDFWEARAVFQCLTLNFQTSALDLIFFDTLIICRSDKGWLVFCWGNGMHGMLPVSVI